MTHHLLHMSVDIWLITFNIRHMTYDIWLITHDCWHMTQQTVGQIISDFSVLFFSYLGCGTGWNGISIFLPTSSDLFSTIPHGVIPIETTRPPRGGKKYKTCVSSMIHSARPIFLPVAITILNWNLFALRDFKKVGTGLRTDVQTLHVKIVITTGHDFWSASWINKKSCILLYLSFFVFSLTPTRERDRQDSNEMRNGKLLNIPDSPYHFVRYQCATLNVHHDKRYSTQRLSGFVTYIQDDFNIYIWKLQMEI